MFSFSVSANNTNAKVARVISPVAYGGTPWSRRALTTGNGIGAVQVSSPSGVSKLNLPITTIIGCNDKLVRIMADAIHSTQELKSLHASAYARDQVLYDCSTSTSTNTSTTSTWIMMLLKESRNKALGS